MVLLNLRELLRPRDRECRQTRLSVRWINLVLTWPWWTILHLSDVKMARISSTLICSCWLVHLQPVTTFHFQSLLGTEARNLWNLTWSAPPPTTIISSPLMLRRLVNFVAKTFASPPSLAAPRRGWRGSRRRRSCRSLWLPGCSKSNKDWGSCAWQRPRGASNCARNQLTTTTDHELPRRVWRRSSVSLVLRFDLTQQGAV